MPARSTLTFCRNFMSKPSPAPGDIWVLGDHRLVQGDACDPDAYDRLMVEGEMATFVLTDSLSTCRT